MAGERDRRPLTVAWDEAREVLVVVLLATALLHVAAPMIRYAGIDRRYPWWDDLHSALTNVNALTGLLLVGAAVAVCTTPASDMVPRLRQSVYWASVAVALLGVLAIINVLSVPSAGDATAMRLAVVAWRPGPAVLLSGCAAWMARRVVLLG
ncbi:MAG: hypothetical protein OXG40_12770 [Acidimicrobiaceae bacterium]|nr:hypothetical protein [Acidimicrobiaceae bacterium]MDE0517641.1 hypothetical protein [Acidimicrobiaceae bacterium]MDE0665601.1 hypothetical protein [Acidimicrobiaceae bacterium]MYJ34653.1 hypothetical protein [Acidimicrobiaceae bacterium]